MSTTDTETDTGMLDEADRRKARDVAQVLIGYMHAMIVGASNETLATFNARTVQECAAAIRDLDAVACGPVSR